jgi:hypothetical protein
VVGEVLLVQVRILNSMTDVCGAGDKIRRFGSSLQFSSVVEYETI